MKNSKIYSMTLIALFAALICIVSPFSIPIGLVPISLSSVVILLSTYIIGYKRSVLSCLIYILLGLFMFNTTALAGSLIHVLAHMCIKVTLFLSAGAFIYKTHKRNVDDLVGMGKVMPIVMVCFSIASLGLVGYVSGQNVVQTAEAVKGIYYVCNAIPALCYLLIIIGIGFIFNLDKKTTDQMYAEMAAKRGE